MKTCKSCGQTKAPDEFLPEPRVRDGLTARCRTCLLEYGRQWAVANAGSVKRSREAYKERNADRHRANRAAAKERNTEARRLRAAEARVARGRALLDRDAELRKQIDGVNVRLCSKCRRYQPYSAFSPAIGRGDGLQPSCKACGAMAARKSRAAATYEQREAKRRYMLPYGLKRLYGILLEDYQRMRAVQEERCGVCHDPLPTGRRCHVDHDHRTGIVRGLLCGRCNNGLGQFRDDPATLRAAAAYLENSRVREAA